MQKKQTIGNTTAMLMVALAFLVDGAQFLLSLTVFLLPFSLLLTIISGTGFALWFFLLGAYKGKQAEKKVLASLAAFTMEFVPLLNALPAFTASVVYLIVRTRIGDAREAAGKAISPKTALAAARLQRMRTARAARTNTGRESREEAQQARHAPANDNSPRAANDNTSASQGQEAA